MASGLFWLFFLLVLTGGGAFAGYALAGAILCAFAWLLTGDRRLL